jgi:NHLM bacteriocin system ABC transporter ATP-binding protein
MSPELSTHATPDAPTRRRALATGLAQACDNRTPLLLHESRATWLVVQGALNVFAIADTGDTGDGPREFLYRIEEGALCVGYGAVWADRPAPRVGALVAVGDSDTRVAQVDGETSLLQDFARTVHEALGAESALPADGGEAATPRMEALSALQRAALRAIERRLITREQLHESRLAAKRSADASAAAVARQTVSSLLSPHLAATGTGTGVPLHDAMRAVGAAAGVDFRFPRYDVASGDLLERARYVALASGVGCRPVRLTGAWWRQDAGPLLAFTRTAANSGERYGADGEPVAAEHSSEEPEQPLVLLPSDDGGYCLVHPVSGEQVAVTAATAPALSPYALQFYRALPATPVRSADLLHFGVRGLRHDVRAMVISGAAVALLALVLPLLTRSLFDQIIPGADLGGLSAVVLALVVASASGLLFEWVRAVAALRVRTRLVYELQAAVLDRMLRQRAHFFRRFSVGDLGRRALGITELGDALGQATVATLLSGITGLISLALLFWYSVPLALLSVLLLLLNVSATLFVAQRALGITRVRNQAGGELSAFMLETLRGMTKLRVAAAEARIVARWATPFHRQQQATFRFGMMSVRLSAFLTLLDVLARLALFAGFATLSAAPGSLLTTGSFMAFAAAEGTFRAAIIAVSTTVVTLLDKWPAWERARPLLEETPETAGTHPDPGVLEGRIALRHVHFAYEAGEEVLHDVSLDIPAGTFVAIVGPSGSGKSTLLRLLLGFEVPQRGAIVYDGQELHRVDLLAVRRQIGVVLQHASLSQGDIYSNITGSTPRPQEVVWEAARMAGIEEEIRAMPMGLQTLIPDGGSSLSGGQRQRLLIARALISRPRMLFFDEATSALDSRSQRQVSESVATLQATRIVIAHRLSTVRQADRIIVLDRGRIVESGRFDELLAAGGLFARLAAQQEA